MSPLLLAGILQVGCGRPTAEARAEAVMESVVLDLGPTVEIAMTRAWIKEQGGRGTKPRAKLAGTPPLVITGERSSWQLDEGTVLFEGTVEATRGEVVVRCDRMEVTYDGDRVREAVARGGVEVRRGERIATGETAKIVVEDGTVVLTGDPRLREGQNQMSGEVVTLHLDDERLECTRCRLEVDGDAVRVGGRE